MNNQYYLYYSCAGVGAPAAIGLATASNLTGPWTDRGMIVAGNNAIDPSVLIDGGNLWLTYGNWNSGIDLIQLNPSTGTRPNSNHWDLIPGEVECPALITNGSFYYLFFQRGLWPVADGASPPNDQPIANGTYERGSERRAALASGLSEPCDQ